MNKKKSLPSFLFAFLIIKIIPLVSAYGFSGLGNAFSSIDLRQGWDNILRGGENFLAPVFQLLLDTNSGEFFFAKCLMLILLFIVIQFILKKSEFFEDRKGIVITISLIVAILAMRFMPENDFVKMVLIPYGVLGVALLTFIPLAIYFMFVYDSVPGHHARLLAWIVYAAVFFAIVAYNWNSVSGVAHWIYIGGLVLVVIFMLLDSSIKSWRESAGMVRGLGDYREIQRAKDYEDLKLLLKQQREGFKGHDKAIKRLLKRLGLTIDSSGNVSAGI